MRRWMLWIPALMMASLLYWTLALGLGGLSLMALTAISEARHTGCQGRELRDTHDPLVVHLQSAGEIEEEIQEGEEADTDDGEVDDEAALEDQQDQLDDDGAAAQIVEVEVRVDPAAGHGGPPGEPGRTAF